MLEDAGEWFWIVMLEMLRMPGSDHVGIRDDTEAFEQQDGRC